MLGAISGDIIGSVYEFTNVEPDLDFPLFVNESEFTDDTVLTVALADSILNDFSYQEKLRQYYLRYPEAGYGGMFHNWARSKNPQPYGVCCRTLKGSFRRSPSADGRLRNLSIIPRKRFLPPALTASAGRLVEMTFI